MTVKAYTTAEISLAAAGSETIDGPWDICRFLSAVDGNGIIQPEALINVTAGRGNETVPFRIGNAMRAPGTRKWILSWAAQPGTTATLGFANAGIDWDADPPTTLAVLSSTVESLNDQSFYRGEEIAGVVSTFSYGQLWNPAASGKVILLDWAFAFDPGGTTTTMRFHRYDTALTSLFGTGWNKNESSSVVALGEIRGQNSGSNFGTLRISLPPASTLTPFVFGPPLALHAGEGLLFRGDLTNTALRFGFQWREQPA